jgi:hypothetical protein
MGKVDPDFFGQVGTKCLNLILMIYIKMVLNIAIIHTEQFHVLATQCVCVFYVDLRTNRDYLYNINWLVCIT